jgi:glycosyltransferase involved in cell wall biosynthesis
LAIEGMASGKPLVASNVDCLTTIVKDAGILFKPGDAKELSSYIDKLFTNNIYYQDVANRCQQGQSNTILNLWWINLH